MRGAATTIAVLMCVAWLPLRAQDAAGGRIAGRVGDRNGGPLGGVTIEIVATDHHRQVTTDPDGRFAIGELPPGQYIVTARLSGCQTATRAVALDVPRALALDLVLQPDCLGVGDAAPIVDLGVATNITAADAVVRVRILDRGRATRSEAAGYCISGYEHRATVVALIKAPSFITDPIRIVRTGRTPYAAGEERIVFLHLHPSGAFVDLGDNSFVVDNGRVHWTRSDLPGVSDGSPVESVMDGLRGALFMTR
jgi:hypothetical protein